MTTLAWIITATIANGLIGLIGGFTLLMKKSSLQKTISIMVAFAAGALLGGAFFHIIPESLETMDPTKLFALVLVGFGCFFIIERVLHWHHCHKNGNCDIHPVSSLIIFGDAIHNFTDGLIIAASFLVDIKLGMLTTLLIIIHEIPQELGDYAVLIHAKMEEKKALFYNLLSQCTSIAGGIVGFYLGVEVLKSIPVILSIAAGGFIYIAASDLIPGLHKESSLRRSMLNFLLFTIGVVFTYVVKLYGGE